MLSPVVIRDASPSNWCKDPQPNIRCTSGNPTEYGEERLWEPERPTLPCKNIKGTTDLGSWEHMKTESPTRDHLWDWSGPSEQVLQLCGFVFLWDSWQRDWGLPLTLLPGSCILFLLTSFSLNKRGSMSADHNLISQGWLIYTEELHFSNGKRQGKKGKKGNYDQVGKK